MKSNWNHSAGGTSYINKRSASGGTLDFRQRAMNAEFVPATPALMTRIFSFLDLEIKNRIAYEQG
jgi:hypothetical protein